MLFKLMIRILAAASVRAVAAASFYRVTAIIKALRNP